jgi:transcriptional regulator with XRE-family HTH domain
MLQGEGSDFARLVTEYRQQHGMSQGQLAQVTRLSRTYVYHLETGQRVNPSPQVVKNIVRALSLQPEERDALFEAYQDLTGQLIDPDPENGLLDMGELAQLLAHKTSYPTHVLDRLWYLYSWNEAATRLFELENEAQQGRVHLFDRVFQLQLRRRFHGWEQLSRRLVSDFLYGTRTLTHQDEYKVLWKHLRSLPDFKRIATISYPRTRPAASFVMQIRHSQLGLLTLRTATTVFTGINSYSMVSYVPGDQQTLEIYRRQGW